MSRSIVDILREVDRGRVVDSFSDTMAELVQAVRETGKQGKITLSLTVKPEGEAFTVSADVKATMPPPKRNPSIFFARDDGSLTREHPQGDFEFKGPQAVPAGQADTQTKKEANA